MKKVTLFTTIILLFVLVTPVHAGRELPVIGDRLNIGAGGEQEFSAGTPFHIRHGWFATPAGVQALGVFDFNLEIIGVPVKPGLRYVHPDPKGDSGYVIRIYNFPAGMPAGTYTFVGRWYTPCQYSVEDCSNPNTPVLSWESTVTITFLP